MLGIKVTQSKVTKPQINSPVLIKNNEAISNSSSPLENEQIQREIEIEANAGKIELQVELTEEQQKQQDTLSFGQTQLLMARNASAKSGGVNVGIGYGQNSFKNQAELIESKKLQGQQGVQQINFSSQDDLLDVLARDIPVQQDNGKQSGKK